MININKFTQLANRHKISIPLGVEPYLKVFLSKKPISEFSDYPMFFGYYFREAYRKAVDDLIKAQTIKKESMLNLLNDSQTFVIEDEIFLPDMSPFQIEQQKKHVIASLQNVHYLNS